MDYVIKNSKNLYVRLNSYGCPVLCCEADKTLFEFSKAKNILDSLPKTMRKYNLKVEALPEIMVDKKEKKTRKQVLENNNYTVSEEITRWVEKFGICDDILKEAQKRKEELWKELSYVDRQFSDIVHKIEFGGSVNMYEAWLERKQMKNIRKKRRNIKDEILVLSNVLKMDFRNIDRNSIDKVIAGLANRRYSFRIVEEDETDAV